MTNKYLQFASYAAVASVGGLILYTFKLQNRIKEQPFFTDAMDVLNSHPGATKLLGEPIKYGFVGSTNIIDDRTAQYEVPVKGPKQKGTMYFWVQKGDDKNITSRIELELNNDKTRRLLVKDSQ